MRLEGLPKKENKWVQDPPDADAEIVVRNDAAGISMSVNCSDVDLEEVKAGVDRMVDILNAHWEPSDWRELGLKLANLKDHARRIRSQIN